MEMQELRYAAAVYRERHFVRAANRAHVSKPADVEPGAEKTGTGARRRPL